MTTIEAPRAAPRLCAGKRRPGTALKLWIPDATHAHMETAKSLTAAILGAEPSLSLAVRLSLRYFADYLHELHARGQRPNGQITTGPEVLRLRLALDECRDAAR